MRRTLLIATLVMATASPFNPSPLAAQPSTVAPGPDHPGPACPPGATPNAPTVGKESSRPLSDQLADSKGVICPPAGIDPGMRVPPPEGGAIRVVPPPAGPNTPPAAPQ